MKRTFTTVTMSNAVAAAVPAQKTKIVYVGDPMCSTCWGMSNELLHLQQSFYGELDFEVWVGGLRPGGGDPWDNGFKTFLKSHWKSVNELTGQPFEYSFFDRETFSYDTEPACRAVVAAKEIDVTKAFTFFEAIQRKFYVENEDPCKEEFYASICYELGINYFSFLDLFRDEVIRKKAYREFLKCREYGVISFPTVFVIKEQTNHFIANGYMNFTTMSKKIEEVLKK